ncbi:methyltransferase domain-containing protein [Candidatus Woesearchaeota archaeon]|jgi:tRNA (adenine57-N1/adenine58-N1)-methyltransferase catalytic subunit|nr:methyltransferase domain-containing protein [Candidatus Woesearchaeota archaeon]MBT7062484.1 methyltransferase domain-containing protein [Candidatus Woesearchaeota archaeon]MBT7402917.1 methyltransferase domain-containing protein [Candidatus Woesearchaeota archaeon]
MKLIIDPKGKKYLMKKGEKEFHTQHGVIKIQKKDGLIETHKGTTYLQVEANFTDKLLQCGRGPQVVLPKDAAAIVAHTNLQPGAKVVDAGAGSGWLSSFISHYIGPEGRVTTYEIRKEFAKIAKDNFKFLELTNIKLKNADITKGIKERKLDLITLDLLTPTKVPNIPAALKKGGYVVAYVPHLEQAEDFVAFAKKQGLYFERTIEVIEREWGLKWDSLKEKMGAIGHTAYLVFCRKI